MAQTLNQVKNPDFGQGKSEPRHWTWSSGSAGTSGRATASAVRAKDQDKKDESAESFDGIRLTADGQATGRIEQAVRVRGGEYYRVEADVFCTLTAGAGGGFSLSLQFFDADDDLLDAYETARLRSTDRVRTLRGYLQAPDGAKRAQLSLGIHQSEGLVLIESVRMMRMIEPDLDGHALSVPPPPHTYEPVRTAASATVCSKDADGRPLTELLIRVLGGDSVSTLAPASFRAATVESDALFLPDAKPPSSIKSLAALLRLAENHIVVISLPAFQTLAEKHVTIRTVTQPDDPIHARVAYAHHCTHGFALHDVFPFAWTGRSKENFRQRQFSKNAGFKEFCEKRGFEVFLESMCDKDSTSQKPTGLFRQSENGMLFVVDIEPLEVETSLFGEVNLAAHLLLAMLGHTASGLGQYSVPYETEGRLRGSMRDMSVRFAPINTHDADVPEDEVREQLVTAGDVKQTFGLPVRARDAIIIRSGLVPGDMESVYGPMVWLKQLVRMAPHTCPYAEAIGARYRIAWMPSVAPFIPRYGFGAPRAEDVSPIEIDTEDSGVAAIIDVVSIPEERIRVVLATDDTRFERYRQFFPKLTETFTARDGLWWGPSRGERADNVGLYSWHTRLAYDVEVVRDANAFTENCHRDARNNGATLIRLEVPGGIGDFVSHSIRRTDAAATSLEHVIGLLDGLIAVNRRRKPVQFDGFAPLSPGQALVVDDPATLEKAAAC